MSTMLVHIAIAMLICACVLMSPHLDRRNGLLGGVAFALLAGISMGAFAWMTVTEINRKAEAAPISWQAAIAQEGADNE